MERLSLTLVGSEVGSQVFDIQAYVSFLGNSPLRDAGVHKWG